MPKCLKCGSYYIRAPCPVCSPPGVGQLIEDSKEAKGKSVEELQTELETLSAKFKSQETEYDQKIRDVKTQIHSLEDQNQSHEVSKINLNEKISNLQKEIEMKGVKVEEVKKNIENLYSEKSTASGKIATLETEIVNVKSTIQSLNERIQEKKKLDEEQIGTE